jgi:MFS family permease
MKSKVAKLGLLHNNKSFVLFLLCHGITSLGDSFQLIAVAALLVNITGNGIYAAIGVVCTPIASLLFSSLAGYLSDILPDKILLVNIDLLRGILTLLFISNKSILGLYALIMLISILDILYNPPRRKFITRIIKDSDLMAGNSYLTGVSGVAFIFGPVMAGLVISKFGTDIAFLVKSVSFFISALIILIIRCHNSLRQTTIKVDTTKGIMEGFTYSMKTYSVRKVIAAGTVLCIATASINFAFYPFVFDVLKISNQTWGNMMSIYYGTNLAAMVINLQLNKLPEKVYHRVIKAFMLMLPFIWFSYSSVRNIMLIFSLLFFEGIVLAVINIYLITRLQLVSRETVLGRVIGTNDFINNFGKLIGISAAFLIMKARSVEAVFMLGALIQFLYLLYEQAFIRKNRRVEQP